ncbi:MAG: hypothetical protein Q8O92_13980 [Candidatus Latescibacter sp.]|nr:hypothetical protein [Candidatus Latescibacter sp.]
MRRRDTFRLIPLAALSMGGMALRSYAQENRPLPAPGGMGEPFSMRYLKRVREKLTWIRENQSQNILEAAYAIARTVEKGNRCWCYWDQGHTNESDIFPDRNGVPEILTPGYDPKTSQKGDLLLANFPFAYEYFADIAQKDIFVIGGPCPWGGDARGYEKVTPELQRLKVRPYAKIWIEDTSDTIGAAVKIPGSPAYAGPESGPVSGSVMWMMLADACRALAIDGKPVKVKGDEPKLTDKTPWVSLAEPLLDDYFNTIMMQYEMIGMEMGNIRKMAGMVVDSLLAGGKVYFYSRYHQAMNDEANGRRGGFAFANGLSDGNTPKGSSKDCVIMGTYKPDDEADLKNLDLFKKLGMRAASIGPVTRDVKIPQGRAVFKETEVHVGRMTDTYGLFAIPGFEQKVCPTSGMVNCAILWTMSMEVIEQVMQRTGGNIPAINMNGALKGGMDYYYRMQAIAGERGY